MFGFFLLSALLAVCLVGITRAAIRTWSGQGFQPCIFPEQARTDSVKFRPGTYTAGQVVGQATTLTATNDVQTITITGTPTGGTFKLTFNGVETGAITWSGTAATLAANIAAALAALDQVGGAANVSVSSSITVPAVTFQGDLGSRWQPLLTLTNNALTGGTTPTMTIAHTTPGRGTGGEWAAYDDTQSDGTDIARGVCQYAFTVTPDGRHYYATSLSGAAGYWSAPVWIRGHFRTADLTGLDAAGVTDLGKIVEGAVGSLTNVATVISIR